MTSKSVIGQVSFKLMIGQLTMEFDVGGFV